MALSFQELKAKILVEQAKKERGKSGGNFGGDNAVYPFWNNPDGSTAILRFLPDGDENNDYFWQERLIIKLPFPGIKGSADSKPVEVQVPCVDMWKPRSCPITAEISPWWKDKALEDMARKYYRKKSFLFQGFVVSNPVEEESAPQNLIRRFIINPSVFERIKIILLAQDVETSPIDYDQGLDFYLTKTKQGQYSNYDTSGWTKPGTLGTIKPRALNTEELDAIKTYNLWNLSSFLPKKPDEEHMAAIMELFHASVNEELYDVDRWGQLYPYNGMRFNNTASTDTTDTSTSIKAMPASVNPATTAASILNRVAKKEVVEESDEDSTAEPVSTGKAKGQTPDEIIAAIKRRQQK
jgi:hypothetical protein